MIQKKVWIILSVFCVLSALMIYGSYITGRYGDTFVMTSQDLLDDPIYDKMMACKGRAQQEQHACYVECRETGCSPSRVCAPAYEDAWQRCEDDYWLRRQRDFRFNLRLIAAPVQLLLSHLSGDTK